MSITELSKALDLDKAGVSRMVKRGMPVHSISAAESWRQEHAKPRAKRGQSSAPSPPPPARCATIPADPPPGDSIDPSATGDDSPAESLRRARSAETEAFRELDRQQKNGGSLDDLRRASSTYISSRTNRFRAERDFLEYQKQSQVLLYLDEAKDIASRPHETVRGILQTAAKSLTPRIVGMPARAIETALADFFDILTNHLRQSLDP
jgi:hypothetical protein